MGDERNETEVVDLVIDDDDDDDETPEVVKKDGQKPEESKELKSETKISEEPVTVRIEPEEPKKEESKKEEPDKEDLKKEAPVIEEPATRRIPGEDPMKEVPTAEAPVTERIREEYPKDGKEAGTPEEPVKDLSGIGHQDAFVDQKAFKKKKKTRRILVATLITLTVILIAGYTTMVIISTKVFQPNTVINGVDYSFRTEDSVQQEIDAKKSGYYLNVKLRNGEFTINPEDVGLIITTASDVHKIKEKQNPFLWFMAFFDHPSEAAYVISYDKDKLSAYLDECAYFKDENMIRPENPTIVLSNGKPVIREGNPGTLLDRDKVAELLDQRIMNLETEIDLEKTGCYINAEYNAESEKVVRCRDTIASYTELKITYLYGEKARFVLRPEDIYNMLEIDQEKYYCAVSKTKVESFVAEFAASHDTYGKERLFKTHFGKMVRLSSQTLGWEIDQENEVNELVQNLVRKMNIEREPMFLHTGKAYTNDCSDIGNSYVELDLSIQKVYFYMDGQLILEDDIISGNPNKYQNTPGGFYEIYGMRQNVVLTGPGYASHVDYWMPFNGEIGLHDAYWQSKFGGDLYLTRGSHGCVNLPFNTAKTIYEMGYRGLPVICYWRNENYLVQ